MRALYLFEFCDQSWLPASIRECLFDLMGAFNSGMRSFNRSVAIEALQMATAGERPRIVELGAGKAPITKELLQLELPPDLSLVVCDRVPNAREYQRLEAQHPGTVVPTYEPVDLTTPLTNLDDSVLVLAGVMHHIPFSDRPQVLRRLMESGSDVTLHEPLARSWISMCLAALSCFPAMLLPILFWNRPGRFRRFLWCWLVPVAPLMFSWDGVVSCLRQWTIEEWRKAWATLDGPVDAEYQTGFHSLRMSWQGRPEFSRAQSSEGLGPVGPNL